VIRDDLFAAFRTASDSPAVHQLRDQNDALVDTTISINEDGSGTVDIAATKVRFPWVTLLSSHVEMRLSQLAAVLSRYPLCQRDADSFHPRQHHALAVAAEIARAQSGRASIVLEPENDRLIASHLR
jgi:hypothetical protein